MTKKRRGILCRIDVGLSLSCNAFADVVPDYLHVSFHSHSYVDFLWMFFYCLTALKF